MYYQRGEYQMMRTLGEQLHQSGPASPRPDLLLEAHHALWATLFLAGRVVSAARPHVEQAMRSMSRTDTMPMPRSTAGTIPALCCRAVAAPRLWLLGYPDQAVASSQAALALAQQLAHPLTGWS